MDLNELPKHYDYQQAERKWYELALEKGFFHSEPDERTAYTIVIPPPNVTGVLHMGHVLNNTIQDVLCRRKRMEGYNVCWVPGTDHASIATEAKVVKMLKEKGISKKDLTREEFLRYAWEWKEKYGGIILQQLKKLGCSCDWQRTRFTMEESLSRAVTEVFVRLYEKGWIYKAQRLVNWDVIGKTAISDEEVIYKEVQGKLYFVKYFLVSNPTEYLTIATTRPETILADVALAVHPEDERYAHLVGKEVFVPLIQRKIPVIADTYVDKDFGTGCLKITPAHDFNDYEVGKRHQLPVINILNPDGTLNADAQLYVGLDRLEVRNLIVKDLEAKGHIEKIQDYVHHVGFSERTDAVVEPYLSWQWYVKMKELAEPALKVVLEGKIKFYPNKFINTYRHWLENVKDWCISRQLWWGHRIPAYYYHGENQTITIVARNEKELNQKIEQLNLGLKRQDFVQDEDCLDTWFSSWLWPLSVFDYFENPQNADIQYYYPTNDLVTAPEIMFFWVARMIMAGLEFHGNIPFRNVYYTGIVRDKIGRKMSKSLGNSPDPLDLIEKYSADGVRMGMLEAAPAGNDLLFDEAACEHGRNFTNKIWNALKLVKIFENKLNDCPMNPAQSIACQWMNAKIQQTAMELQKLFEQFRISEALMLIYKGIWDDFCSTFLEIMKPSKDEPFAIDAFHYTLQFFEEWMKFLHPFMPFITEEVWHRLKPRHKDQTIMFEKVLISDKVHNPHLLNEMETILQVITQIRAFRSNLKISPNQPIEIFVKTQNEYLFQNYFPILQKLANLQSLQFVNDAVSGTTKILVFTHELYIPFQLDEKKIQEELQKLQKELDSAQKLYESATQKLSNEKFLANAKAELVEKEKQKQVDAQKRIASITESINELKSKIS